MSSEKFTPHQEEHPAEQEPRSAIESLPASIQAQLRDGVVTPDLIQRIDPSLHSEVARLISKTRLAALVANLGSFYGLDQSIAIGLARNGYTGETLEHLDHFTITDHHALIAAFTKYTSSRNILNYRDRFKLTDTELAEAFINAGARGAVFTLIRFLPNVDFERITELLYQHGRLELMAENLGILRDIDQDGLAQRILEMGDGNRWFLYHVTKFDNLNQETAEMWCAKKRSMLLHLGRFKDLDESFLRRLIAQETEERKQFTFHPASRLAFRLDRFKDFDPSRLTRDERWELTDERAGFFLNEYGNYKALALLLQCHTDAERKKYAAQFFGARTSSETLQSLTKANDWATARDYLDCLDLVGVFVDQSNAETIRAHAALEDERRTESDPARERYADGIRVTQEIARFYLDQFMRAELKQKLYEPRTVGGVEFTETLEFGSFKNNVACDLLQRSIENNTRRAFEWIRQYLVTAVHSELKHQENLEQPLTDVVLPPRFKNLHDFLTRGTEEELRQYCSMAEKRFKEIKWRENVGGEAWARIARLAREMWGDVHPSRASMYVDRAFQIEHNTGMVFDKDPRALAFSPQREKDMLDAKFEARTIDDLLKEMDSLITDSAFKEAMHDRVRAFRELMQAPVREIGGE